MYTFWAQMNCMRARKSGKVSMDAEFYAEDKTTTIPMLKSILLCNFSA